MPLCAECETDNPEVARFCLACGAPLASPPAAEEERKPVTAVFVDLVGSTAQAEELDPEDVLGLLEPYYAHLRDALERFGGTVEKFIGDAVVALFGAPVAHEDDPERAVRAGFAILAAIEDLNRQGSPRPLRVRIGINTGDAIVALGAHPGEGRGMAWGDVLNTAARLQSAAPEDGILVGMETYSATAAAIEYREREPISAKGKAEPVQVWEAVAVRGLGEQDVSPDLPLVGRAEERRLLAELWDEVRFERRAVTALLIGAPGVGKSRLLSEFARGAGTQGAVLSGRCLPYGEGITYWALTEMIRQAAGVLQSDDLRTAAAKLGALLDGLPTSDQDELRTMAAALAALIGAPTTPRGTYAAEEISQAELHWGLRRLFELLATSAPLVLLFEAFRLLCDNAGPRPREWTPSMRPSVHPRASRGAAGGRQRAAGSSRAGVHFRWKMTPTSRYQTAIAPSRGEIADHREARFEASPQSVPAANGGVRGGVRHSAACGGGRIARIMPCRAGCSGVRECGSRTAPRFGPLEVVAGVRGGSGTYPAAPAIPSRP